MYPFGKGFNYLFEPYLDNEPVQLPAGQSPEVYIFTNRPSREDAASGTGAIAAAIIAWTDNGAYSRLIAVPAIADPEPTSETVTEKYWISVNYVLEAGGQVQTEIRLLQMERVRAVNTRVKSSELSLQEIYPNIVDLSDSNKIRGFIDKAIVQIKGNLKAKGYEWAQITRLDQLSLMTDYRALMFFAMSMPGDRFEALYEKWKQEYISILSTLLLEYDENNDGEPEPARPIAGYTIISR
jgi:hypothetical protein